MLKHTEATRVVLVTCGSMTEAQTIAHSVVQERLAGCVNIVPGVTSVYRWQGQVQQEAEVILVIKTRDHLLQRLHARIEALHAYEVNEFLALAVESGSEAYLEWLAESIESSV